MLVLVPGLFSLFRQAGHHDNKKEFPRHAPGTAPVHGPCGTLGGWPRGCQGDGTGHFGDCCSGNCDGFALGKVLISVFLHF